MNKQDQYITIEFESITGSAFFTPETQYELKDLDTDQPKLIMNNVEFIGRYELTTGTDILLPKSPSDDSVQLCEKKIIFRPSIPLPDYSEMLEQNKSEQDLIPQENETNVAQL